MLNTLYIRNFILINELNIDFRNGFSVFTGETGAGKSIFIDAIGILAGDRLTVSMIKTGAEKCVIEGEFTVTPEISEKLEEAGYDNDTLIITREINSDGRSISRINHRSATVGFIKDLLTSYVDIHSQHDNQYLLNEKYHLSLLDSYCHNDEKLAELKKLYSVWHKLDEEYLDLLNNEYSEAQIELVRYQADEIEKMNLKAGEQEEIEETLRNYARREKIDNTLDKIRDLFADDRGVLANLYDFTKVASSIYDVSAAKESIDTITNAYYVIEEEYDKLMSSFDYSDFNMNTIDELNNRLYDIQRIKRKYNSSVEELLEMLEGLKQQLSNYDNRDDVLKEKNKARQEAFSRYENLALEIRKEREKGSNKLEKAIVDQLKDLNLENARFRAEITEGKPSSSGMDNVRFLISMNPGQPLRPLSAVASGGELSRLMLGLKNIFASLHGSKLVIFDEIDAGVSGYVAYNIGRKMHQIANDTQVFAVTHLASVVAWGDSHYHISKIQKKDDTDTSVELLDDAGRIEELAVLSTSNTGKSALIAAEELLNKARSEF